MKRATALGLFLSEVLFFCSTHAVAEIVIGPGVVPPIGVYSSDHYHLLAGTQITSPSLTRPPESIYSRVNGAAGFQGGGSVRIDGGTYRGGNDTFTGPGDTYFTAAAGNALQLWDFTADIYGGTFVGGDAYSTSRLEFAIGGVGLYATNSTVNIYGGKFVAGMRTQPNIPYYPSNFPPVADAIFRASNVHLYGGELNYIILSQNSTLHIYGIEFQPLESCLCGRFANGRSFNLLVYNEGHVVLHDLVPEPSSIALVILACVFLPVRRRT